MKLKHISTIKTKEEARQIAIDYQYTQSKKSISYVNLFTQQIYFEILAKKFNLLEEFKQNGII